MLARLHELEWAVALSGVERVEGHEYENWGVAGLLAGVLVVIGEIVFAASIVALNHQ